LTCSLLAGRGVGSMVIMVVVLRFEEKAKDMNLLFLSMLVLFSFIYFEELFGIGEVCF